MLSLSQTAVRASGSLVDHMPERRARLDENIEDKDEVSPDLLETMSLAGTRFLDLQRRARGLSAGR